MTNLHELFVEATSDAPPSRLSVEDVYSATRTQRRLGQLRTALATAAALAMVAAGGITLAANLDSHPSTGADPPVPIVWAARGDATHLYTVTDLCQYPGTPTSTAEPVEPWPTNCKHLWASDDGGATWVSRGTLNDPPRILGPLTLLRYVGDPAGSPNVVQSPTWELSTDGGATWRGLPSEGQPIDAIPPGATPVSTFDGMLRFFDPEQGRVRKLAHQPVMSQILDSVVLGSTDIWVSGWDRTSQAMVAVSHDGGATWTERVLPGGGYMGWGTLLVAHDGTTGYAMVGDGAPNPIPEPELPGGFHTFRTTDGGTTWVPVSPVPTTPSFMSTWITADGRIVLALAHDGVSGAVIDRYEVSTDGITYAQASPPGLPDQVISIDGSIAFSNDAVYVSDDGWTWQEVWHG